MLLRGLQEQRTCIDSLQRRLAQVEQLAKAQDELAEQVAELKDAPRARVIPRSGGLGRTVGAALFLLLMGGLGGAVLMANRNS